MGPVYDFSGQVALVTGASSGIGLATAQAFATSGANVVLVDVDRTGLDKAVDDLRQAGHTALAIPCDISDETQVAEMVESTIRAFGRLDMAFNNAGVLGPVCDLTAETALEYDRVMAINLRGTWACLKHELLQMARQGSGAIVNCSSLAGLVGQPGRSAYQATKHGVLGLTKGAALDYAARGIRVNAVCPGVVNTPMSVGITPEHMTEILRDQPIGRFGYPHEVAAAVLWLCSPAASFVLGATLPVDGGFTTH
jgi:NAD(P)-dependent dehydrogenase (short-subunit alcohol dehydrogenase family)